MTNKRKYLTLILCYKYGRFGNTVKHYANEFCDLCLDFFITLVSYINNGKNT